MAQHCYLTVTGHAICPELYCMCGASVHVIPFSSGLSSFLPPPKHMPVAGQIAPMNKFVKVCAWCSHTWCKFRSPVNYAIFYFS